MERLGKMLHIRCAHIPAGQPDQLEDLVATLMGQIRDSDWLDKAEPMGISIFDLAAQEAASAPSSAASESKVPATEGTCTDPK